MGHFFIYPDELDQVVKTNTSLPISIGFILFVIDSLDSNFLSDRKVKSVTILKISQNNIYSYPSVGIEFAKDRVDNDLDVVEDYVETKTKEVFNNTTLLQYFSFFEENAHRINENLEHYNNR